ncbi:MAG: hypothetical protein ABIS50_23630 [Luteolibacter sp.]|uniref:hypothetical protein n=1 Tax=Luteolibacter sp. TaxID=1962973 RepID=UPI003263C491
MIPRLLATTDWIFENASKIAPGKPEDRIGTGIFLILDPDLLRRVEEEADVIIIAATSSRDTREKAPFLGPSSVPAVGVETSFEIVSVLKGEKFLKKIVFHHLRLRNQMTWLPAALAR